MTGPTRTGRPYRRYSYGPLLDLFVLDMRSYRGPNSANLQTAPSTQTTFLGREQLEWLKSALDDSRAVWKVVAADMPLGLNVGDGTAEGLPRWEAIANGESGAPKGRELEFVELLGFLKRLSPLSGFQFFGEVNIDAQSRNMTVDLRDINGLSVFSKTLPARFY